jgi:hypothetical protein
MGCGSSSAGPFFETAVVLKLPASLDSAGEIDAYDYILSTCFSPAVLMQLTHLNGVTSAFEVRGGVVTHKFEMGDPNKPQSEFYETKHRTNRTIQMESFVARGTISDPAAVKEQAFCVTATDINLKKIGQGVQVNCSVGQPKLNMPGGGVVLRMFKSVIRRRFEQIFAAMEELYANDKVPPRAPAGGAQSGQATVVDGPQWPETQNATGATFGSMQYGGLSYGV